MGASKFSVQCTEGIIGNASKRAVFAGVQLKKQWRKEWEAETFTDARTVRESIDRKVEEIKQRVLARRAAEEAAMSDETRELQRRYEESLARDRAAHEQTPPLALGAPEED